MSLGGSIRQRLLMSGLQASLALSLAVVTGCCFVLWFISLALRDASIVDPCWGAGFVVTAWTVWLSHGTPSSRAVLVVVLTTIWGLRLSLYLGWRNLGHGEDRRYAAMRAKHGSKFAWVSLFTVFLLQALILWFVSWPVLVTVTDTTPAPVGPWDVVGGLLWAVGLFFETVGDWQFARFRSQPENAGRVLDTGLWRYTRHPNYFGDFCVWWGLYLVACGSGAYWTLLSPILMSVLLLKVSGVTLLESDIHHRRPEYRDYIRRTSPFFPRPPIG